MRMSICGRTDQAGKPFDVVGIKGGDLDETRAYAAFLARSAKRLYATAVKQETVRACPACGGDTANAIEAFRIFEVPYCRCGSCGHGFVRTRPSQDELKELFSKSDMILSGILPSSGGKMLVSGGEIFLRFKQNGSCSCQQRSIYNIRMPCYPTNISSTPVYIFFIMILILVFLKL